MTMPISIAESRGAPLLFLRKTDPSIYKWSCFQQDKETNTDLEAYSLDEALRILPETYSIIGCGYLFTLPERDEHGTPALFSQMAKSLASSNGIYFDEDYGHNCVVHQIPLNTRRLYESLLSCNRI